MPPELDHASVERAHLLAQLGEQHGDVGDLPLLHAAQDSRRPAVERGAVQMGAAVSSPDGNRRVTRPA